MTNLDYKEKREIEKTIQKVNKDDLCTVFGASYAYTIMKKEGYKKKLDEYLKWKVPVKIGDIIKSATGGTDVVTCVYTDNSVDLLNEDGVKKNVGLYGKKVEVVGFLKVFINVFPDDMEEN